MTQKVYKTLRLRRMQEPLCSNFWLKEEVTHRTVAALPGMFSMFSLSASSYATETFPLPFHHPTSQPPPPLILNHIRFDWFVRS